MKSRIPVEIDNLIWTLAETQNKTAIDEFNRRHPQYRADLTKRIEMVGGLKAAKSPSMPPKFEPLQTVPADSSKLWLGMGIGAGLVVLALVAFWVTFTLTGDSGHSKVAPAQTDVPRTSSAQPSSNAKSEASTAGTEPTAKTVVEPPTDSAASPLISLDVSNRPLSVVFAEIEKKASVQIIAPDSLKTKLVSGKFKDIPAMALLAAMGDTYGFSAIDQNNGEIVVLPGHTDSKPTTDGAPAKDDRHRLGG